MANEDMQSSADKEHGNLEDNPMDALRSGSGEERRAADRGVNRKGKSGGSSSKGSSGQGTDTSDYNALGQEKSEKDDKKKKTARNGILKRIVKFLTNIVKVIKGGGIKLALTMLKAYLATHGLIATIALVVTLLFAYFMAIIVSYTNNNVMNNTANQEKVQHNCAVYIEKGAIGYRYGMVQPAYQQEETARRIYSILSYYGFRPEQSFAVLGNWEQESGLDPTSVENQGSDYAIHAVNNPDYTSNTMFSIDKYKQRGMYYDFSLKIVNPEYYANYPGSTPPDRMGIGLGQWTNDRTRGLLTYASIAGHGDHIDPQTQQRTNEDGTIYTGTTDSYYQWYDIIAQMGYALDTASTGDTKASWMESFAAIGSFDDAHLEGGAGSNQFDGDSAIQIELPDPSPLNPWHGAGCDETGPYASHDIRLIAIPPESDPACVPRSGFGNGHPMALFYHGIQLALSWDDISDGITVYPYAQRDTSTGNATASQLKLRGYDMIHSSDDYPIHSFWTKVEAASQTGTMVPIDNKSADFDNLHQGKYYGENGDDPATVNGAQVGEGRDKYYDMGDGCGGTPSSSLTTIMNGVAYDVEGVSAHGDDDLGSGMDAIRQHCADLATRYCDIKAQELKHWNPDGKRNEHYYYDYVGAFEAWHMEDVAGVPTKIVDGEGRGWFHYEPSAYIHDWTWFYRLKMSQYMTDYYTVMFLKEWEGVAVAASNRTKYAEAFCRRWWESTACQKPAYQWDPGYDDGTVGSICGHWERPGWTGIPDDIWNCRTTAQLDAMLTRAQSDEGYNHEIFGFVGLAFAEPNLTGDGQVGSTSSVNPSTTPHMINPYAVGDPTKFTDRFFKVESAYGRGVENLTKDTTDALPDYLLSQKIYTYDLDMQDCDLETYITNNEIAEAACRISYPFAHDGTATAGPTGAANGNKEFQRLVQKMFDYEHRYFARVGTDSTGAAIDWGTAPIYQSCDITACIAIRTSGCDDSFPKGPTLETIEYLVSSPRWTELDWGGDETELQPGDVFIRKDSLKGGSDYELAGKNDSHHVAIYVSNRTAQRMLSGEAYMEGLSATTPLSGCVVEGSFGDHCPWLTTAHINGSKFTAKDYHVFRCTNPQSPSSSKFYGW